LDRRPSLSFCELLESSAIREKAAEIVVGCLLKVLEVKLVRVPLCLDYELGVRHRTKPVKHVLCLCKRIRVAASIVAPSKAILLLLLLHCLMHASQESRDVHAIGA
jgi:hypothetical protein